MEILKAMLPEPVFWDKNGIKGELFIFGDLKENRLQFSFRFDEKENIYPLIISFTNGKVEIKKSLSIINENKHSIESYIFNPTFLLSDGFSITNITYFVTVKKETCND
jgi:hypothetical protein